MNSVRSLFHKYLRKRDLINLSVELHRDVERALVVLQTVLVQHFLGYAIPLIGAVTLVAEIGNTDLAGEKSGCRKIAHRVEERHALHHFRTGLFQDMRYRLRSGSVARCALRRVLAHRTGRPRRQRRGADLAYYPLRHYVMGEACSSAPPTPTSWPGWSPSRGGVADGACGFSTDLLANHRGFGAGRSPAATPAATSSARCATLRDRGAGVVTIALDSLRQGVQYINDEDVATLRFLVEESGRPVSFLPMVAMTGDLDFGKKQLARLGDIADRVVPQVSPMPIVFMHTMRKPFKFSEFATWRPALNGTYEEQRRLYADPEFRRVAAEEQRGHIRKIPWERCPDRGGGAAGSGGALPGPHDRRDLARRGQGAARRLPRSDARGRPAHPVPVREREPRSRRGPLAAPGAALHASASPTRAPTSIRSATCATRRSSWATGCARSRRSRSSRRSGS